MQLLLLKRLPRGFEMKEAQLFVDQVGAWVDPELWFGIVQPVGGNLYEVLYPSRREAEAANREVCGTIVVVTTRIGAQTDQEYVEVHDRYAFR